MKLIYLAHPVGGNVDGNLAAARRWLLWIYKTYPYVAVVAPWIVECELLDDESPADREAGLERGKAVIGRCDEIWLVGGRISDGMAIEAEAAADEELAVIDLTEFGPEPPQGRIETDEYEICWDCECNADDEDDDEEKNPADTDA